MKDSRLFGTLSASMFLVAILSIGCLIWQSQRASVLRAETALAENVYGELINLKSNVYQLFKQYADALLIGDRDKGTGEAALSAQIGESFKALRALIGQEIELVGREEIEELETLNEIERRVARLVAQFETILASNSVIPLDPANAETALLRILDIEIDRDFIALIAGAIDEERREVEAARAALQRHERVAAFVATALVVAALVTLGLSLATFRRRFSRPLSAVLSGARAFSRGQFSHRIGLQAPGDLAEVGRVLDDMAAQVAHRQHALEMQKAELETRVAERTRELERLLEMSEQSEAHRARLLADVSHELRTPLTIIQGEAEIALRGQDKEIAEYKEALAQALATARHCGQLVDDLMLVARREAGALRLDRREVDLVEVVRDALRIFGEGARAQIAADATAPAIADGVRIRQCLLALLQNARRYGGTDITIDLLPLGKGWRLMVSDNGVGMSDDEKARAFERFFRGANAAKHYLEGTGLGLPVVRAIVEAHGGRVMLSDRRGGGLVATFEIPREPSAAEHPAARVRRLGG